ncbi:MAG: hypothetical protein EBU90_26620 [Proteobacteria bacterium]|nr:hypothetical protein [Pseudomonadota bacterium]
MKLFIDQVQYDLMNKSLSDIFDVNYTQIPLTENDVESFNVNHFSFLGIKQTEEHKKARSEALKGNLSCGWMRGKTWSNETKDKMSFSAKQRNLDSEYIKKQSEAKNHLKRKYKVIDPEGNCFVVFGINQFCKGNGLSHSSMILVAQGKRNSHKGWKCEYYE